MDDTASSRPRTCSSAGSAYAPAAPCRPQPKHDPTTTCPTRRHDRGKPPQAYPHRTHRSATTPASHWGCSTPPHVAPGEIAAVIFLLDPLSAHPHDPDIATVQRVCNVHNIPIATNLAAAELIIQPKSINDQVA